MAQLNFNAGSVEPATYRSDPVPPGSYVAIVEDSQVKPTKDGTGKRLNVQFKIVEGTYKDRRFFDGFNIQNKNPEAEQIAWGQLSALCRACGKLKIADSSELHGVPLSVKLGVKAAQGQYEAQNVVRGYFPIIENGVAAATVVESNSEESDDQPAWMK